MYVSVSAVLFAQEVTVSQHPVSCWQREKEEGLPFLRRSTRCSCSKLPSFSRPASAALSCWRAVSSSEGGELNRPLPCWLVGATRG